MEHLKQTFKIDNYLSVSFESYVEIMDNERYYSNYELFEWLFNQQQLVEQVGEKTKLIGYNGKKGLATDVIVQQYIPYFIFMRQMLCTNWHFVLRQMEEKYPQQLRQFLQQLALYEQYVGFLRTERGTLRTVKLMEPDPALSDAKQMKLEQTFEDLLTGAYWPTKAEMKMIVKFVQVNQDNEAVFKQLIAYVDALRDFPLVYELLNMRKTLAVSPDWFAHVCATVRLHKARPFHPMMTEKELEVAHDLIERFRAYDRFMAIYADSAHWDEEMNVADFVSYFATKKELIYKIAAQFTKEQQVVAFKNLLRVQLHVLMERMKFEPSFILAMEQILPQVLNELTEDERRKFQVQFNKNATVSFIEAHMLQQQSLIWFVFMEPARLIQQLKNFYKDEDDVFIFSKLYPLMTLDWSILGEVGADVYQKYWLFLFERAATFRHLLLVDPIYIVRYAAVKGTDEKIWLWLQNNASDMTQPFTMRPMRGLDQVLLKIGQAELVQERMASWLDNAEHFETLRAMQFDIVSGDEEGYVTASTVLQNSMLFELEDEMLTEQFEKYRFKVNRIGLKSSDGTILRRAKIKADLQQEVEEDLDDWLSNLESL